MQQKLKWVGIGLMVILAGIQFIPVNRANPAVTREVKWNTAQTRVLAQRACFDCHSNETSWPLYSYVAPVSLLVNNHVVDGRRGLNFSTWDQPQASYNDVKQNVDKNDMPRWDYLLIHGEAKLSAAEKQQLLAGLQATYQQDPPTLRQRGPRPGR